MKKWERVCVGDVAVMKRGKYVTRKDTRLGNIPVILGGQEPAYYCDETNHEGPCVVISRSGASAGFVSYWDEPIFVTDGFLFEANERCDIRFLYYCLKSNQSVLGGMQNGSGIPHVQGSALKEFPISLPPLPEQRKIANALTAIDRKIALNRKRIATLEAMAKKIYDYWFVQFDFPDAHGRPYKSSGGAMVYNPDLKREIPKGWEVVRIGDVLDRHILSTNKIPAKAYGQFGAYPIIDQSEKFIAGYTDDKNAILDYPFCTVFGDHSCELKAVNFPFARGADGTQIVVSADANVPNVQLYFALRMMDFGGGYKRHFVLAKDSLIVKDAIGVAAPRFEKVEKAIFDGIKHCRFENFKLTGLRDFLLPVLMNGQVNVG